MITDIITQKIFNLVLLPAFLFGIIYNAIIAGWAGLELSLLGTLAGLGVLIIPFIFGFMGAGDVKLLAAIGAIKGYIFVLYTTIGMSLAGGVIAMLILIYQRRFLSTIFKLCRGAVLMAIGVKVSDLGFDHERTMFPYATAIVAGAIGAMWWMR